MKVMIVPSWYPNELNPIAGIFFEEQALALQRNGIEVMVAYPEVRSLRSYKAYKAKKGIHFEYKQGMKIYRHIGYNYLPPVDGFVRKRYLKWLTRLFEKIIIEQGKPDVIHAHAILNGGWAAAKIAQKYNIPLVVTEHSSAFTRNQISEVQKKYIIETLTIADEIIAVGPSLKNELELYTEKTVNIIPNIVDMEFFRVSKPKSINKRFRFFSLAFLNKNKGMDTLLKAFQLVLQSNNNVELVIAGEGQEKANLINQSKELGIDERVMFIGGLSRIQVVEEMHKCDSFILASRSETFGVVYIEALASGKPIIATKCGGPNMIVNEKNGLIVDVDQVEDLASAMLYIVGNIERYIAEEIIEDCNNRFSEEAVFNQLQAIYKVGKQGTV